METLSYSIVRNVIRNNLQNVTGIALEDDTKSIVTSNYPIHFGNGLSQFQGVGNGVCIGANDSSFDYDSVDEDIERHSIWQDVKNYVGSVIIDIVAGCTAILVSHPFSGK